MRRRPDRQRGQHHPQRGAAHPGPDLHATTGGLQWIVDSYAMVFGGLLLAGGSVADRFGRKRFFLIGLAVFAGGSAAAAFAGRWTC